MVIMLERRVLQKALVQAKGMVFAIQVELLVLDESRDNSSTEGERRQGIEDRGRQMGEYGGRSIWEFSSDCVPTEKWGAGLSLGINNRLISEKVGSD